MSGRSQILCKIINNKFNAISTTTVVKKSYLNDKVPYGLNMGIRLQFPKVLCFKLLLYVVHSVCEVLHKGLMPL